MEYFYINQNSLNNPLRVELINDGKFDFKRGDIFNKAIQNADVTFTMTDEDGILKVSNAPCSVVLTDEDTCDPRYIIEYQWKKRDTSKKGKFNGKFEITFNDDLYEEGVSFPTGNLIMPIHEDICIIVK